MRSDAVLTYNDNTINLLRQYDIKTIIDLRSDSEVIKNPCDAPDEFCYRHIKLHENGVLPQDSSKVGEFYFEIADEGAQVYKVLDCIANTKTGVLYFCRSGKDRTGIITALLLALCDYPSEYIIDDYALSGYALKTVIAEWSARHPWYPIEAVTPLPTHISAFLDLLYGKYGSVQNYLLHIGLTENTLHNLKTLIGVHK